MQQDQEKEPGVTMEAAVAGRENVQQPSSTTTTSTTTTPSAAATDNNPADASSPSSSSSDATSQPPPPPQSGSAPASGGGGPAVVTRYLGRQPTPEELQKIRDFEKILVEEEPHLELPPSYWEANNNESKVALLWRFVVANEGNLREAKKQLASDVAWREKVKLRELQKKAREEVVGLSDEVFEKYYRCVFLGHEDAEENFSPVCYRCLSNLKTWELLAAGTTVERMISHELWQYEMDCARIFENPESFPARALIVMIDISHMTFSQCTKDLLSILGGFSEFSKVHHPERLRKLYILGAPRLFSFVWNKIISNFIPASTKEKIHILSDYRKANDPFLNKWMPRVPPPSSSS